MTPTFLASYCRAKTCRSSPAVMSLGRLARLICLEALRAWRRRSPRRRPRRRRRLEDVAPRSDVLSGLGCLGSRVGTVASAAAGSHCCDQGHRDDRGTHGSVHEAQSDPLMRMIVNLIKASRDLSTQGMAKLPAARSKDWDGRRSWRGLGPRLGDRVERDARGDAGVERLEAGRHRDRDQLVAGLARRGATGPCPRCR